MWLNNMAGISLSNVNKNFVNFVTSNASNEAAVSSDSNDSPGVPQQNAVQSIAITIKSLDINKIINKITCEMLHYKP